MEINVNINANKDLTDAIVKFSDALELIAKRGIGNVLYNSELIEQITKEVKNEVQAKPLNFVAPVEEKTNNQVETEASNKPETKVIKLEDVRSKLAALSKAGKKTEVKNLLNSFGVQKLTDVPSDKYEELLKKAEEL